MIDAHIAIDPADENVADVTYSVTGMAEDAAHVVETAAWRNDLVEHLRRSCRAPA